LGANIDLNDRENLGDHHGSEGTLNQARDHEQVAAGGDRARDGGQGEPRDTDEEHPFAAVYVAHATAGDQQYREREHIARHDPFELSSGGAQIALNGGKRHSDDCPARGPAGGSPRRAASQRWRVENLSCARQDNQPNRSTGNGSAGPNIQ
jgi:hypothetical protein